MTRIGADDHGSYETNTPIRLSLDSSCLRVLVVIFNHKDTSGGPSDAGAGDD